MQRRFGLTWPFGGWSNASESNEIEPDDGSRMVPVYVKHDPESRIGLQALDSHVEAGTTKHLSASVDTPWEPSDYDPGGLFTSRRSLHTKYEGSRRVTST